MKLSLTMLMIAVSLCTVMGARSLVTRYRGVRGATGGAGLHTDAADRVATAVPDSKSASSLRENSLSFAQTATMLTTSTASQASMKATIASAAAAQGIGRGVSDPIDLALDYILAKLRKAELGNVRLTEHLQVAERNLALSRKEMSADHSQLQALLPLRNTVRTLMEEKESALSKLLEAGDRESAARSQLRNASEQSEKATRTVKKARVRLAKELKIRYELTSRLLSALAEMKRGSQEVQRQSQTYGALQKADETKDVQLERDRNTVAHMQQRIHELESLEEQDRSQLQATSQDRTSLQEQVVEKQHEFDANLTNLVDTINNLKKELATLKGKEFLEARLNAQLSDRYSQYSVAEAKLTKEEEAERAERANSVRTIAVENELRQQVLTMKQQLTYAELHRQKVQSQATHLEGDLFTSQVAVHNVQAAVQSTVPWLRSQLAHEQETAENATVAAAVAAQELDASRQALAAARVKIDNLEKQYSDTVGLVGKSAAKEVNRADNTPAARSAGNVMPALSAHSASIPARSLRGVPTRPMPSEMESINRDSDGLDELLSAVATSIP